jgi:hypothetical protein
MSLPAGGGLMGYSVDFLVIFHRPAYFVDKMRKPPYTG